MSIEHVLRAREGSELDALALWWLGIRRVPRAYQSRHYAVLHSHRCDPKRCRCTPVVVRVPGGLPA